MILNQFFNLFVATFLFSSADSIAYRSLALQQTDLMRVPGTHAILDDTGQGIEILRMKDNQGLLYWFRRIKTPVCLTGECKLVDVGLYWDCTGDFFGIDVYGEHLTKTDHSTFSDADYEKLLNILNNDWSILREYNFEELTGEGSQSDSDTTDRVDATSGATRKEIASEAVKDAVYTTYTLWHLVHGGEKEQLEDLTLEALNESDLIDRILESGVEKYTHFLLDLFSHSRIARPDKFKSLIIGGLYVQSDPDLQHLALKSLTRLPLNDHQIQEEVAQAYTAATDDLRLRILGALRDVRDISENLYAALEPDVNKKNEWFSARVLELLKWAPKQSPGVIERAKALSGSKNSYARTSAEEFLKKSKASRTMEH